MQYGFAPFNKVQYQDIRELLSCVSFELSFGSVSTNNARRMYIWLEHFCDIWLENEVKRKRASNAARRGAATRAFNCK